MSQDHRTLGEDWRWCYPVEDVDDDPVEPVEVEVCISRIGAVYGYQFDQDDPEVTPSIGAVDVVIPGTTTADWLPGTYQIQVTTTFGGAVDITTPIVFKAFTSTCLPEEPSP
jgi:hypothetical protein